MGRALALTIVVLLVVPAFAAAQAVTRGSPLTAPANVPLGCEASVEQNFSTELFELVPTGSPSCTWWSSGMAADPTNPNSGHVPTAGTVTNVRVRSGRNPAALRVVQLRVAADCCTVVRHSEPFQPRPNAVTQVTLNWLVEAVPDSFEGVSTGDIIGFSAIGSTGTLPLHDQGPAAHTAEATFQPGVHTGRMAAPMGQLGVALGEELRNAVGYEPLVQYDFVACPALNNVPIPPGTVTCPGQNTGPTGANVPSTTSPSTGESGVGPIRFPRGFSPRLRGTSLPLSLVCNLDVGCSGRVRLVLGAGTARSAKAITIASQRFKIKKGRHQVKVKLSKKNRARLRKRKTTKVSAVVTIPGQPTLRTTLRVRR